MKIIYHCYGGAHSSVTAAGIHLGLLPTHRLPTGDELMRLPYFDKTDGNDFGLIRMMGVDEYGNEVYVLGKKGMGERFSRTLEGMAKIIGAEQELRVVNTMACVNWIMMIGGYLSRRMGLLSIGRPLVIYGTRKAFFHLVKMVKDCQLKARDKHFRVSLPRNKKSTDVVILGTTTAHHSILAARMLLNGIRNSDLVVDTCWDAWLESDGSPVFVGTDKDGNRVYTIGVGREMETGARALACLVQMFESDCRPILITAVRIKNETWVRTAAALSRWPGGQWLNRVVSKRIVSPQLDTIREQVESIEKALHTAKAWDPKSEFVLFDEGT